MADPRDVIGWSQEILRTVDKTVNETIRDSAVLRSVVPSGPVMDGRDTVPFPQVDQQHPGQIISGQPLVPVVLHSQFRIAPEQNRDEGVIYRLVLDAADRLAQAEDAVILYGEDADDTLDDLGVGYDNLEDKEGLRDVGGAQLANARSVLQGVNAAVRQMAPNGAGNRYRAVLSPDLFGEAHEPTGGSIVPLEQIRSRLDQRYQPAGQSIDQRVVSSGLLEGRRGVVFRVTTQPVDLIFTLAPRVVYAGHEDRAILLDIEERFVLRVMDPRAIRPIP